MRDNQITKMLLAVLLTICVSVTTARSAELIPLRATYAAIGGAFAPLWIAQDKGVFNKYGLAVDLKYMLSATGTQALLSGSMDIVNPATELIEAAGGRVAGTGAAADGTAEPGTRYALLTTLSVPLDVTVTPGLPTPGQAPEALRMDLNQASDRFEGIIVQRVLEEVGGNVSEAARVLGLHRNSLRIRLSRWKLASSDAEEPGAL